MTGFVEQPNLPQGKVRCVAVSHRIPGVLIGLEKLGIESISAGRSENLPKPVAEHADLLLHHLGSDKIVTPRGETSSESGVTKARLIKMGFTIAESEEKLGKKYPDDCLLNCFRLDGRMYGGRNISREIRKYCAENKIEQVTLAQGYSKCSVCIVSTSAAITSDKGIAQALKNNGVDVLLISPGGIAIDEYDYGFIGGCCGKLDKSVIGFCGEISQHKSYSDIRAFLNNYGISAFEICGGELFDVGGIIPLVEEKT